MVQLILKTFFFFKWRDSQDWTVVSSVVPSSIPIPASLFHSLTLPNPLFFQTY